MSDLLFISSSACLISKIAVRVHLPAVQPKAVVLLLHGATLPSIIFDLPGSPNQLSMMSYLAANEHAAYSLDYRGYGHSSKPVEMDDPQMKGSPLITHYDATFDVNDVVQLIKDRHPNVPVILCGFSWGSSISGYITARNNWVSKLILLGPVYSYANPQWKELADPKNPTKLNPGIKSYRIASRERWCGLWERELKSNNAMQWQDQATLQALLDDIETTDADWAKRTNNERCIRIPTGVLVDALQTYNQTPIYDASKIQCPTLVLRGEQDTASLSADADGLMAALGGPKKRIDIANSSHYGILEKRAELFFEAIVDFIRKF